MRSKLVDILYKNLKDFVNINYQYNICSNIRLFGYKLSYIVDGFEREIYEPCDKIIEPQSFSTKKSQHSLNTLFAIEPKLKLINFISNTYGGCDNDDYIAHNELINTSNSLNDEEIIIGDEGFTNVPFIRTILNNIDPAPRYNFNQYRVIVENAISSIKKWWCIKLPLRCFLNHQLNFETAKQFHNKLVIVVAAIENLKTITMNSSHFDIDLSYI